MSLWFALLGLGLAPVMVGATEVIVGNAPLELSGVAGGLQQAAMQVGGSLGTAVLGAVMASRVDSDLPDNWADGRAPAAPAGAGGQARRAPSRSVVAPIRAQGHPAERSPRRSRASPTTRSSPAWAWPSPVAGDRRGRRRGRRLLHQARREREAGPSATSDGPSAALTTVRRRSGDGTSSSAAPEARRCLCQARTRPGRSAPGRIRAAAAAHRALGLWTTPPPVPGETGGRALGRRGRRRVHAGHSAGQTSSPAARRGK